MQDKEEMPSAYPALICALDPRLPRLSPTRLKSYPAHGPLKPYGGDMGHFLLSTDYTRSDGLNAIRQLV